MSRRGGLLLGVLLLAALPASAEQTPEMTSYRADTGQRSLDAWLADLNHYVERHPDAFLDALHHGTGVPRSQLQAWLATPGRQAADLYLACHLAQLLGQPCQRLLALRPVASAQEAGTEADDADADAGWQQALAGAAAQDPALRVSAAHWQQVREHLARDYRYFARPQPGARRAR